MTRGRIVRGRDVTLGKETASGRWKFIGDPVGMTTGGNYGFVDTFGNASPVPPEMGQTDPDDRVGMPSRPIEARRGS